MTNIQTHEVKQKLQNTIFNISRTQPFFSNVLQCLEIQYSDVTVPTAGVCFNKSRKKWELVINPNFFCNELNDLEREAVLIHEIYHITHNHIFRSNFMTATPEKRQILNIAMDMAINQYIPNIPKMAINVENFKDDDGTPWEKHQSYEYYYKKLKENAEKYKSEQPHDSHDWDHQDAEEVDKETSNLIKRALQKNSNGWDKTPEHIQEAIKSLEASNANLSYKKILESAVIKHASGVNRVHTWFKPSRRYGNISPGTKVGNLPYLANYIDTSGSISVEEVNTFLGVIDGFLRSGSRKCTVSLWHTELYKTIRHRCGMTIDGNIFENGGTDVESTLLDIHKRSPNLSIILTDGYFGDVKYESWIRRGEKFPQVCWVISSDGDINHPLKRLGMTVKIP